MEPAEVPCPSLLEMVRAATRTRHAQIEEALNIERGAWTNDRYVGFLRATLSVVGPIASSIDQHLRLHLDVAGAQSRAARRLEQDLDSLAGGQVLTHPPSLPAISTPAHAFGAAYVLEGSRLGGEVIARVLSGRLGLSDRHMTYLRPHDGPIGRRWHAFGSSLDAYGRRADRQAWDAVIETALVVFAAFGNAFREEGVLDAG
jgi:heme oxygenase (biliverdin-IX-beta and delta-forming)